MAGSELALQNSFAFFFCVSRRSVHLTTYSSVITSQFSEKSLHRFSKFSKSLCNFRSANSDFVYTVLWTNLVPRAYLRASPRPLRGEVALLLESRVGRRNKALGTRLTWTSTNLPTVNTTKAVFITFDYMQGCKLLSDIGQCPTKFGKCQNKAKF